MSVLEKRKLGNTGIEVSCLGLGTVKFGRNQEVKYPTTFSLPTDQEVQTLLARAAELGINLLDTAPAYGSSEQRLGRLLKNREQWVICSKVGEEFLAGTSVYKFDAAHVRSSIERSLRDLHTDYLDIVLIHSDGRDKTILDSTDCVETLQRLQQEGLVRSIGMSSKTVDGGIAALERMDVVMATYNKEATADATVIDFAAQHGKGILIKKALNSGHVSTAADGAGKALEFALSKNGVSSVIVGTINASHLQSNVEAAIAANST